MTFKIGVIELKNYIESEEKACKQIDERLRKIWSERNFVDNMDQAVLNRRNINIRILKDILQELETDDMKLSITFSGPRASDLPNLAKEEFNEKGIKLEGKGGLFQASAEAYQSEFIVFWVSSSIGILSGGIAIADFIYQKLKKYQNTKTIVGKHEIDSSVSQEDLQKIIQDELQRIKEEIENFKNEIKDND